MPRILVVDDELSNRALLRAWLADENTSIVEAESGEQAIELVQTISPDLVLLDVMMPGIDGFDTTRRIKDLAGQGFLPVILVTALADREARVHGLDVGADDFLSKPIDRHELMVRVRNLLALREKEATLRQRNVHLLQLMRFRDEMTALLVHDLKNPTSIIDMSLEYVQQRPELALHEQAAEAIADARGATDRIARIVANMLDLVRLEANRLVLHRATASPAALLSSVAEGRAAMVRQRTIHLDLDVDPALQVNADIDILTRVIENVVDNSIQHVSEGGRILMRTERRGGTAAMLIGNDGPPVPPEMRESIFEKFARGEETTNRRNLGLGLYFCRLAMEAHGGRIWVADRPLPAVFGLELPLARPPVFLA
jgi:two-component system, sensor histidine kinase and response regulator